MLNIPVRWRPFTDYSALGAAAVGARGVGVAIPEEDVHAGEDQTLMPVPENAKTYRSGLSTFRKIYPRLSDIFHEISGQP